MLTAQQQDQFAWIGVLDAAFMQSYGRVYEATMQAFLDELRAHLGQLVLKVVHRGAQVAFELGRLTVNGEVMVHRDTPNRSSFTWLDMPTEAVARAKLGRLYLNWIERADEPRLSVHGTLDVQRHRELGLLPGQSGWRTEFHDRSGERVDLYIGDDAVTTFFRACWRASLTEIDPTPLRTLYRLAAQIGDPLTRTLNLKHLRDVAQAEELRALEADTSLLLADGEDRMALVHLIGLGRTLDWMDLFGLQDHPSVQEARRIVMG